MENPAPPAQEESDAAQGRDGPELCQPGQGQEVETAGKEQNADGKEPIASGNAGLKGQNEHGQPVDEVIEGGGFPIGGAAGLFEPLGESVSPEGPEGNAEKEDEAGETESGGRSHAEDELTRVAPRVQAFILAEVRRDEERRRRKNGVYSAASPDRIPAPEVAGGVYPPETHRPGDGVASARLLPTPRRGRGRGRDRFRKKMKAASAWHDTARLDSPDGRYEAVYQDSVEICMGGPTVGTLIVREKESERIVCRLSSANGAFVWAEDSRALAYPLWTRDRCQKLAVLWLPQGRHRVAEGTYSVLELERFADGLVEGVDSPIYKPRPIQVRVAESQRLADPKSSRGLFSFLRRVRSPRKPD